MSKTMKHIFIFNAAPLSGKDAICNRLLTHLFWHINIATYKFKTELIEDVLVYFKIDNCLKGVVSSLFEDRKIKETPLNIFKGFSPRQALQYVSEKVIKPNLGDKRYGVALGEGIKRYGCDVSLISDGGFVDEILGLFEVVNETHKIHIVHINRDGCTFEGDTRKLLTKDMFTEDHQQELTFDSIDNNGTIEEAVDKALNIVLKYVDTE